MPILKPLNNKLVEKNIFSFDVETYGDKNKFLMGSVYGQKGKLIKVFWDKEDMKNFILSSHYLRCSYLFATNLSFDFLALFGDSMKELSKFEYIIKGSDMVVIKYRNKANNVTFLDTLNYLRFGVANLGKILGINKLKQPECLGKKVGRYTTDGQELEIYNIRDSEVTYKFAEFLQKSFLKLGVNMKFTAASTAMNLFRNKYLDCHIAQPSKEIIKEQFKGYFGGRVEAFFRGKIKNCFYYDINSLYPFCMKKYNYPFPNSLIIANKPNLNIINNYEGLSWCRISCPSNLDIPLLPYREEGKLLFPTGIFYNWQTHAELRKAIELGYNIKPYKTYYYEETFSPFKSYVTDLYNQRLKYQKEGSNMSLVTKLLLNSLYGKMAQKLHKLHIKFAFTPEEYKVISKCHQENEDRLSRGEEIRFKINSPQYNEVQHPKGYLISSPNMFYITDMDSEKYPKFINPILSIYTTSYARLELYKWIELIQKNNKQIYYCDTDSLITNCVLPVSKELGALKKELDIHKGLIVKPKFYYCENKSGKAYVKSKGLRNLRTVGDFDKLIETKKYKYMKFTKFKESLRRGMDFNTKLDVSKLIDFEDNKREWIKKFNKNELQQSKPNMVIEVFE